MIEFTNFFPKNGRFKNTDNASPKTVLIDVTTTVNKSVIATDL